METNPLPPPAYRAECPTDKNNAKSTPEKAPKPYDIELRAKLLAEAAKKPVQRFVQFDFFTFDPGVCTVVRNELRRSECIRLQVLVGTSKADVPTALKQFEVEVQNDEFSFGNTQPFKDPVPLDEFLEGTAPLVFKLAAKPLKEDDDDIAF